MSEEEKVFGDKGDLVRAEQERVFDPSIFGVVVIAPLALVKAVVPAEKDPVAEGSCMAVWGSRLRMLDDLHHHWIMYHFAPIRHMFIFLNGVCHK
jgi:hypothetical protein